MRATDRGVSIGCVVPIRRIKPWITQQKCPQHWQGIQAPKGLAIHTKSRYSKHIEINGFLSELPQSVFDLRRLGVVRGLEVTQQLFESLRIPRIEPSLPDMTEHLIARPTIGQALVTTGDR